MKRFYKTETELAGGVPERTAIAEQDTWNIGAMYGDEAAWTADFDRIDALVTPLEAKRGKLDSAQALADYFAAETVLTRLVEKLYVYASHRSDEDTANTGSQARLSRIRAKNTEVEGKLAWVMPEVLAHSEDELRAWADDAVLSEIRHHVVKLMRRKPHILSDKEETLLSRAGEVFSTAEQVFGFLTDADMKFPDVKDGEGNLCELSQGRFISFMIDKNRTVRKGAFEAMYDTYLAYKNTLSSTLSSQVKKQNFIASTRNFGSALESSLHKDNVPVAVYETLIDAAHEAFPLYHDYLGVRQRQLGLDALDMYDVYVPIVPEYELKVPYDQAREWILAALEPLGEEYVKIVKTAFTDRWVDIYENRGKRSGAYSGGCYDSLPYILLNYQGTLDNVFTLAHELGHSMHTYLASHSQNHRNAEYPIFTAEIPSTLNEALLLKHLLGTTEDPKFRAYLLNHFCDGFKGTVYRQTMFAEFEKMVHEMDAAGQPLTPDSLGEAYYELNAKNFGSHMKADQRIAAEWSRIPHFYYNFYVYKYATSFCASQIFVERVLSGSQQRDQYLDLLRAGGSNDPLELIKQAGVDLTDRKTMESAFARFGTTVKEFSEVLSQL
jgi:oligoendopeptidase F